MFLEERINETEQTRINGVVNETEKMKFRVWYRDGVETESAERAESLLFYRIKGTE